MNSRVAFSGTSHIKAFVRFFNNYLTSLFVAAIPYPVSQWGIMPIFDDQRAVLSVATPIFCFLVLAFLFYCRDLLARPMFLAYFNVRIRIPTGVSAPVRGQWVAIMQQIIIVGIPLLLIACCFFFSATYYDRFYTNHILNVQLNGMSPPDLILDYILAFVFAEAAFVWMALKEYIQNELGIAEYELLSRTHRKESLSTTGEKGGSGEANRTGGPVDQPTPRVTVGLHKSF
jgi:hypothetical protein